MILLPPFTDAHRRGFTLVELSIVVVIIGLIAGGIFVGQSLIRQSQINSAVTDVQKYIQAATTFQQKYGALPGDFATAKTYWGSGTTCSATNASPLTGTLTCNGNGNGQVELNASTPTANNDEALLFWNHLYDAQLIAGKYNGSPGSAGTMDHVIGTNCPASRVDGAGVGVVYVGVTSGDTNYFDNGYGHVFILGGYNSNALPYGKALTTVEAMNLDNKYDDGAPATGNILSWKSGGYNANCSTTAVSATAAYKIASTGLQCSMIFITGF